MTWVNEFLKKKNIEFKAVNHNRPKNPEELAKLRNIDFDKNTKILLFEADNETVLVLVPINKKIDSNKLKKALDADSLKFASKDTFEKIKQKAQGILPPVIEGIKKVVDESLVNGKICFSTAMDDSSGIILESKDLISVLGDCVVEDITKHDKAKKEFKKIKPANPVKDETKFSKDKFMSIKQAMDKGSGEVLIRGWVYRERKSNKFGFIIIRDSSEIIQCVFTKKDFSKNQWEKIQDLSIESSIRVKGEIKKDSRAPSGYEIHANDFEVVQTAEPFPITKDFSTEFLLDNRHLWLRSRKITAVMKIRHTVVGAIHEFFRKRGYIEFDPPIFQPAQCEGGSTLFEVKYFNEKVYLTQSWQLYAEAAVFALEKVYDMAPTFRAEKSKTSRHLSEFWMAEMEAAWMKLPEVTEVAKDEVRFIIKKVLENNQKELKILKRDIDLLKKYAKEEYPTIKYKQALKIINEKYGMNVQWGKDLRTLEEAKIADHFRVPVVVTHYPTEIMGFYKPESKENPKEALCFDMIAPEGYCEIVGGSQRSLDVKDMAKRLRKEGEDPNDYEWYFDLRRYGSVPHSGYGLGVERVIAWICGLDNIKDAIPFPRTMTRKTP
ncbi:asparagine--tRNA ligase [Candidatus Woesearchaeota archaeon]|nr:asparagine--tRNA ligase [Candidatus Woesearchaeota archaeon]